MKPTDETQDTTQGQPDEVQNPSAVLAKNRELLARNAALTARVTELESQLAAANEARTKADSERQKDAFEYFALRPVRAVIETLGPSPRAMEDTLFKLTELHLDEGNKPYLINKATGKKVTITVDKARGIEAPIDPSNRESLLRWLFDNEGKVYDGVDNPVSLMHRPQGAGATGSHGRLYTSSTPSKPPAPAATPALGLR